MFNAMIKVPRNSQGSFNMMIKHTLILHFSYFAWRIVVWFEVVWHDVMWSYVVRREVVWRLVLWALMLLLLPEFSCAFFLCLGSTMNFSRTVSPRAVCHSWSLCFGHFFRDGMDASAHIGSLLWSSTPLLKNKIWNKKWTLATTPSPKTPSSSCRLCSSETGF